MKSRALLAALLLSACAPEPEGSRRLAFSRLDVCLRVREASEQTFRSQAEWEAFYSSNGGSGGSGVIDFSRQMVAARFDGTGSACVQFTYDGIEETDGRVTVRATRHVSPNPCILLLAYPQAVLVVERSDLPVRWDIGERQDAQPGRVCG